MKLAHLLPTLLLVTQLQSAERTHRITIEDYFTQTYATGVRLAPDGRHAVYVESRWRDKDEGRVSELWTVSTATGERRRLTFEEGGKSGAQWSPDSDTIYFTGRFKREGAKEPPYDGSSQIWRIGADGTQLTPLTRVKEGIAGFEVAADGSAIYYLVHKEHLIDDWKELRKEFKADVTFGHGVHQVSELRRIRLDSWREETLVDKKRYIREFAVAPKGGRVAMLTVEDELLINNEGRSRVDVLDVTTEKITTLPDRLWRAEAPSPYGWLKEPAWSDDGTMLAFSVGFDGYPAEILVAEIKASGFEISRLPRPKDVYADGHLVWRPGSRELCYLGDRRARTTVFGATILPDGGRPTREITPGAAVVAGFSFSSTGRSMVTTQGGADYASDLFAGNTSTGDFRRLTRINPQIDTWKLPRRTKIAWKGADGEPVEGILELPPDHDGKTRLPLIVQIHGGPTGSTPDMFRYWIYGMTLHAANGYAVLSPNYRGSSGYGDKFLTDLIGRENDVEVKDILAGVDHLVAKGIADPDRLGVTGWSNGGYLSNCLIATGRFKAASTGAGVFDMTIQWGEEDTPGHVINYLKGLPWERPEEYQRTSPLYHLKPGNKTATLIHVGERDARVPVTHSRALHRAMKYYLDAPCELLIYPGAGHGLMKYRHRLAKLKWDVAWFAAHLK
jgi:dipeptidyl aminopeptidase/acylaminoacyl peptidase